MRQMQCKLILPSILLFLLNQGISSQSSVNGRIILDTAVWSPIAYLSVIPDFDNLFTMSNDLITDKAIIDASGRFRFDIRYLPEEDVLLRIHISKKGDLPASLIIGGMDENHFFLIANRRSEISITDPGESDFIQDLVIDGYPPNHTIVHVNKLADYLDTVDFNGSVIKTELVRSAIFEKLRYVADTCTNPLASLYALYISKFERNYPVNQSFYRSYLTKWRKQKDAYFTSFRKKLPSEKENSVGLYIITSLLSFAAGILVCLAFLRRYRAKSNPLHSLTVQERKVFALLLEGRSNKEISETMAIGISTVKSHVNNIYSKLGINSRKDLLNLDLKNH
jgi:DNA-binding CsgD family transcriptional regulator